jgi:hypothetical protein
MTIINSEKIKIINSKLLFLKTIKKKKTFLKVKFLKKQKILNNNNIFFLVLIPKIFFFTMKSNFTLLMKKLYLQTNINYISYKKGFINYLLTNYFLKNLYQYIKNKNKMLILYNLNLQKNAFFDFLKFFYPNLNSNFYFLYSFYQKTKLSLKTYNYFYNNFFLHQDQNK